MAHRDYTAHSRQLEQVCDRAHAKAIQRERNGKVLVEECGEVFEGVAVVSSEIEELCCHGGEDGLSAAGRERAISVGVVQLRSAWKDDCVE